MTQEKVKDQVHQSFEEYQEHKFKDWAKNPSSSNEQVAFDSYIKKFVQSGGTITPVDPSKVREAFEGYQEHKFKDWFVKTEISVQTEEQKAFDKYIKSKGVETPYKTRVVNAIRRNNNFDYYEGLSKGTKSVYLQNDDIGRNYEDLKPNDFVIIRIPEGSISDNNDMQFTIYGKVRKYKGGLSNELEYSGMGYSTGLKTYSQSQIDDLIKQAGGGGGGQATSGKFIQLPTEDRSQQFLSPSYEGQYGLSLIDYRTMSRSPQLGVAGQYIKVKEQKSNGGIIQQRTDGHVIFNKYSHVNGSNGKHNFGGSIGISGIKKGITITFEDSWKNIPQLTTEQKEKGELIFTFIEEDLNNQSGKYEETSRVLKFTPKEESKTDTPTKHGRFQIELGTVAGVGSIPNKYMLEFTARYGTLKPKGLNRDFEFSEYNGNILKANAHIKDAIYKKQLGDVLIRKVGIAKFENLTWFHADNVAGLEPHFLFAKVPDDCKVPNNWNDFAGMKKLGGQLMTNNLTEVQSEQDEHLERLKFNQNQPYLEQYLVKLPYTHEEPVWCFVLVSSPDNAKRWGDLLSETTITYELKDEYQKPVYLAQGGKIITTASGEILYTYNYKKIDSSDLDDSWIFTDINGNKTKLHKSQIISINNI